MGNFQVVQNWLAELISDGGDGLAGQIQVGHLQTVTTPPLLKITWRSISSGNGKKLKLKGFLPLPEAEAA